MIIRVYTTYHCPACRKLKEYLKEKGLDYEEIEIVDKNGNVDSTAAEKYREELTSLGLEPGAVPAVIIESIFGKFGFIGFSRELIDILWMLYRLEKILEHGKAVGAKIDPDILEKIIRNGFKCVCKIDTECPCEESKKEIEEQGKCHCGLFWKKQ